MPSFIASLSFAPKVPRNVSSGKTSDRSPNVKQQSFCQKLLHRKRNEDKPVDFAVLGKLHATWRKAGSKASDPRLQHIDGLATSYLDWAGQQRDSGKLREHRRLAAAMRAEMMLAGDGDITAPVKRQAATSPTAPSDRQRLTTPSAKPSAKPPVAPRITAQDRASHVRALRAAAPDSHPAVGPSESLVFAEDDRAAVYRLLPVTALTSRWDDALLGLRAAMASSLHEAVRAQTGLDLCLPRATFDTPLSRKDIPVVILDAVAGKAPTGNDPEQRLELQRALVGQWLLGRPMPCWSDFVRDAEGRLRARDLAPHTGPLRGIWSAAVNRGPSALFRTPDGTKESAMSCQPLDGAIRRAIVGLDLKRIEDALVATQKKIGRHLPADAVIPLRAARQLLAPLQALRQAVIESSKHPGVPLEMLMADAGDCLHAIDQREFR